MELSYLVDLILVVVAAGVMFHCWRLGMVASLIRLVGTLVAGLGAWVCSKPVAAALYQAVVHSRLVKYVAGQLPSDIEASAAELRKLGENVSAMTEQFGAAMSEQISLLLEKFGFSPSGPLNIINPNKAGSAMTQKILQDGGSVADALVDTLMKPIVLSLMNIIVFLVLFAVLSAVVAILFRLGLGVNKLPLIGGLNHLLGLAFGAVEAVLVVFLLCMILSAASMLLGGKVEFLSWRNLENTLLFRRIAELGLPKLTTLLG
ncbi:MAG: hypothetical protein RR022_03510 [Angelakisella sp.]